MSTAWIRRGAVVALWALAFHVMSCTSSLPPAESPHSPSPNPVSASTAPSLRTFDLFAGLPYEMDVPDGWEGGGPETFQARLKAD